MSNTKEPFALKRRLLSFKYAFAGIRNLLVYEHNSRIHLLVAILTSILGIVLHISPWQWAVLAIAIFGVFIAEIFNSAIEKLADVVSPGYHEEIKKVKDYCAAAVLLASILAVIAGIIIFLPELIRILQD
ncbi:MAG: diacylglycerol kinase family protein [Bacteroidia bacterium]|nr:MAG: diacylglycerol kinase family protein [Bacteroidia bacterium]